MTRDDPDRILDRLAHALTPAEWSGPALVAGIVALAAVGAITVVQRALVAQGTVGWAITIVHGLVVAVAVPLLARRAVREWRANRAASRAQPSMGVPE